MNGTLSQQTAPWRWTLNQTMTSPTLELLDVLSVANVSAILVDSELKICWYSRQFKERNCLNDSVIGQPLWNYPSVFDYPELSSDLLDVLSTGNAIETPFVGMSQTPYLCRMARYDGQAEGVLITFVDIRSLGLIENNAGTSGEFRRIVFDAAINGVITFDAERQITNVNPAAAKMLGIDIEEVKGKSIEQTNLGGGPGSGFYDRLAQLLKSQSGDLATPLVNTQGYRPDGSQFHCELSGTRSNSEPSPGLAVFISDTGRTIRAERAAEARRRLFEATIGNAGVGIAACDPAGRWLLVNDRLCEMLGYARSELLARTPQTITHPGDRTNSAMMHEMLVQGEHDSFQLEKRYIRKNGEVFWGLLSVSAQKGIDGKMIRSVAVLQDITKAKRLETKLRESVRNREVFLATLSHELRNPLSAMLNATLLLSELAEPGQKPWQDAVDSIRGNVRLMGSMLEDLLDLSRFTNAKVRLRKTVLDVRALVKRSAETIRHSFKARNHGFVLELGTAACYVNGDAGRLEQAVGNLLTNASKYTPAGGKIECHLAVVDNRVALSVSDSGCGIPAEYQDMVFEPFFQMQHTVERSQGGMGLGLPLVRMIARAHDGEVTVQSDGAGKGSRFVVSLPVCQPVNDDGPDSASMLISGLKLLIVDDHPAIRIMLRQIFELRGCDVEIAADGNSALDRIDSFGPDIGLIDIGLPGMDGYQLARRIRETRPPSNLMLVAVTGYGQDTDREKSADAGFDLHLVKPLDADDLIEAIVEHRSRTKSQFQSLQ